MGSFDPDHALAILLQAKFNEEAKKNNGNDKENRPVPVVAASLVAPEWETTDPCPDVHGLFIAFNQRFFWNRLLGVEVKWSPQMTSCAGICVYEGRNGLCSVRLSAPLLKLRPRSDLVETLLHEMIHAYLFVTHNNRDREGHGPEFHKHMYRINKEAGTNITVYHTFHAEVKLYQQHWWRCEGPCQRRPPFFGMVKRARNRAPGPNDRWWANHQAECGGKFIKVREPEGYKKEKANKLVRKPKNEKDIRNFFKVPKSKDGLPFNSQTKNNNVISGSEGSNRPNNKIVSSGFEAVNRVAGFKDLSRTPGSPRGRNALANRGGGTLVVTGTGSHNSNKPTSPDTMLRVDHFKPFSGSGFTLGGASSSNDRSRSRLLSLDRGRASTSSNMLKGRLLSFGEESQRKRLKTDVNSNEEMQDTFNEIEFKKDDDVCNCSVCNKQMLREEVDVHLETCEGLRNVFNNSCGGERDTADDAEVAAINDKYSVQSCPVCAVSVQGDINQHLDECLNTSGVLNMLDEPPIPITIVDSDVELIEAEPETEARVACPICGMRFGESRINGHVNQCLDSESDS